MSSLNPFAAPATIPAAGTLAVEADRAMHEVQAALVIAKRFPRDPRLAMDKILDACTRPKLAEAAVYAFPRGDTVVSGPSIRLLEACAQAWGNLEQGFTILDSGVRESLVLAYCWDLETNTRETKKFTVTHERHTRRGTYTLTDPRDIYEQIANQAARRKRGCIEALIPGDVIEAALRQCDLTQQRHAGKPAEQIPKLLEAFAEYGITPEHLEQRLRHKLAAVVPAELVQLRRIYRSIRDGVARAGDYFELEGEALRRGARTGAKRGRATPKPTTPTPPSRPTTLPDGRVPAPEHRALFDEAMNWDRDPLEAAAKMRRTAQHKREAAPYADRGAATEEADAAELERRAIAIERAFGPKPQALAETGGAQTSAGEPKSSEPATEPTA